MKLAQASVAPGGPPQALGNPRLTTLAGTAPLQVYRHTAYLRFACGDLAQGLRLEPDSVKLKGSFEVLRYDATSAAEPALKASLRQSGNGVIVELGAPRRVVAVEVDPRKLSAGATFELYRLDGDTPAAKPSASASPGDDSRFLESRTQTRVVIFQGPSGAVMFSLEGQPLELDASQSRARVRSPREGPAGVDFTDARFLLRTTTSAGEIRIAPREVTQIAIDSYPTGPRIGLALPVPEPAAAGQSAPGNPAPDPADAIFFWSVAGQIGNEVPAAQGQFDLGAALGKALASGLERFALLWREAGASALPAALDVDRKSVV